MGLFSKPDAQEAASKALSAERQADILAALKYDKVPTPMRNRLENTKSGALPWLATLSPAELLIARSHGIRPIAAVSATCWMHYGRSWTEGHAEGWESALRRLRAEAIAVGANAVVDVKMRTIALGIAESMDFTLVGTAVKIDGLPPSTDPVIATVPALEFVRLLEANIVPTGIAIGAQFQWMNDWRGGTNLFFYGNIECQALSNLWEYVRRGAHHELRVSTARKGNGVLAHIDFSQIFEFEPDKQPKQYLARHIVIGTTIDAQKIAAYPGKKERMPPLELEFQMVVDMHAGKTPLTGTIRHHQSYPTNDAEGAI